MTPRHGASGAAPLPRELAKGVYWLGDCLVMQRAILGSPVHSYLSAYLVAGTHTSILVDAGHVKDSETIARQIEGLVATGVPEPAYIFLTHPETPHAGAVGHLMARFPNTVCCGDVSDLHLVFPEFEDRLRPLRLGDSIDLGGSEFRVVEAVFRDYITTCWGFDTARRVLFTGDGFSYAHYHEADQCGCLAEELPALEIPEMTASFTEAAFFWSHVRDMEPFIDRLEQLVFDELEAQIVAPAHGLPIGDPRTTFPSLYEGLRFRARAG